MQKQNKSLSKGLSVLKEVMSSNKPLTANTLCQRLSIDKSTMSRLVTTLMTEGFLEYVENSKEIVLSDLVRNIVNKDDHEKIKLLTAINTFLLFWTTRKLLLHVPL